MKQHAPLALAICGALNAVPSLAQESEATVDSSLAASAVTPGWMSKEVGDAWAKGYKGKGVTITVVDDFKSSSLLGGNLGSGSQKLRHGQWTTLEAGMIAPLAGVATQDFNSGTTVKLYKGLNVLNLSYGMMAAAGYTASQIRWSAQESSIISYAKSGSAVIAKAAGNDGIAVLGKNARGQTDYLNLALKGTGTAIYVGALNTNGTTAAPATLASYSNTAGLDAAVQKQFLVVGVEGSKTGLYGTSFAAPVITGYAAILGSKFTSATPLQVTNQLLNTARQDTVKGYQAQLHGRGEASITRALAPVAIR
ncbi:S8 family serine peptidase [Hydrogenophaga sp. PBL-H3]|uniref:S8 family serine peptidase n=1 Tax=Hydrogenophaga sp. PBL-H3 TaxID=434010 RepID=UPI00131F64E9|nr:S8 family serine peptidase [Hydrogenophaga sp. PBL-H3]QHE75604.1 S8 family serine peptidase [Hydrogenophaga sp. PBL-H3]QHE80030.1 S8 family serine peptidase [Hydrogenophaga sp. PBL-H3]